MDFYRLQTDDIRATIEVFKCDQATLPDGSTTRGPLCRCTTTLTQAEIDTIQAVIDRAEPPAAEETPAEPE